MDSHRVSEEFYLATKQCRGHHVKGLAWRPGNLALDVSFEDTTGTLDSAYRGAKDIEHQSTSVLDLGVMVSVVGTKLLVKKGKA